ncbi:hypothetical protein B0E45_29790 [Sinorhizobium sp. A49]|nr:hypothetical protein B0E45_29790 [Sinorhizobium sp. A49]
MLCVATPSIIMLFYYTLWASDVYVSEAKLTVREAIEPDGRASTTSTGASSIMAKIGLNKGGSTAQDSMIIQDYLKSRSAVLDVGGRAKLAEVYDHPGIDWFSRLDSSSDIETLWSYWKERVTVSVDGLSNILTLRVRTFSSDSSVALAQELVASSEALINNISRRNREDALRRANSEVERSIAALAEARSQILSFQQRNKTIDPVQSAKQVASLVSALSLKKIELESQLVAGELSGVKGRPGDRYVQTQLDVINQQIVDLESALTGNSAGAVSTLLKDFEILKLREQFAEQIYMLARTSFEEARRKLDRQQLYVVVIVPPMEPEEALYPRPLIDAGVIFLGLLIIWGVICLLVASVRDSNTA